MRGEFGARERTQIILSGTRLALRVRRVRFGRCCYHNSAVVVVNLWWLNIIIDYITRTALRSVFIGQNDLTVRSECGF